MIGYVQHQLLIINCILDTLFYDGKHVIPPSDAECVVRYRATERSTRIKEAKETQPGSYQVV